MKRRRVLRARLVMQVALSRGVVLVAHIGMHRVRVQLGDRCRPKAVAQVVEPDAPQPSRLERPVVAPAERPRVEVAPPVLQNTRSPSSAR